MPSKSAEHIAYTRLTDKHIENYLKNRSFTIKPSDHHDESNHVIKLHYKTKKNLSKLNRNLNSNIKGTRITPDDLHDMQIHDGNGFFDSIKKIASNPIAKSVIKAAIPIASNFAGQQVKNFTGSDAASNITKSLINESSKELTSGQGIKYIRSGGSFAALGSGAKIKSKSGGNVKLNSAIENQQF